jgi:thioredoxin reductase
MSRRREPRGPGEQEDGMSGTLTDQKTYDVVIVGGGPAGLSAAIMLGRARRSVVVIDAGRPRNRFAPHVHGLLGRAGVSPQELLEQGRGEALGYGVEFVEAEATALERHGDEFVVRAGSDVVARRVIVATGLVDELPAIPGVEQLWGTDAVVCPYCDGWEVRDQPIGVVATSVAARNQAHLLRQWTTDLTVFGAEAAGLPEAELNDFAARGIRVAPPARAVRAEAGEVVLSTEETEYRLARVFVGARPRPSDDLLSALGVE